MSTKEFIDTLVSRGFDTPYNSWDTSYCLHKDEMDVYITYGVDTKNWVEEVGYSVFYNPENKDEFYPADFTGIDAPEEILNWIDNFVPKPVKREEVTVSVTMKIDEGFFKDENDFLKGVQKHLSGSYFHDVSVCLDNKRS